MVCTSALSAEEHERFKPPHNSDWEVAAISSSFTFSIRGCYLP